MKETIAEMLKIEAQAKEAVTAAKTEAAEIERSARSQAVSIQEDARRAAQAKAAEILKHGLGLARKQRDETLAQIDKDNEQLRRVSTDRVEKARQVILAALTGR